ncbi:hypothetical protein L3X38_018020 [Prunus dulcis]|uniref:Survival protein SurE-like phosphatase/nucleotidase domain-containing protein n=1 Tax=Prunus dulcis TaxID=3755 RepID=A0AAD4W8F6_PRUDU|nr:hypothetical protein L3X38_018020 [Prunus dulcis]
MAIPTVTVTLSSLSPSTSLFFIDLFSVLYLYHHPFLNPKRESHRRFQFIGDRSVADVSVTVRETIYVSSPQINSATSFEVSGNLSLSGLLTPRSVSLPPLFYSDTVAGAREALICGVSSLYMSLNWKKDVSYESDMKNAVGVSLPLIYAVVKSIQEEVFPKSCLLNIEIPSSPWTNKVLSSIALWLFTAAKAPKDKHPYGHS